MQGTNGVKQDNQNAVLSPEQQNISPQQFLPGEKSEEGNNNFYQKYKELERKQEKLQEKIKFYEGLDQILEPSFANIQETPQLPIFPEINETFLREKEESGDPNQIKEAQLYRHQKKEYDGLKKQYLQQQQENEFKKKVWLEYEAKKFDLQAKVDFPELNNPESDGYKAIAREFRERHNPNNISPKLLYDCALIAKSKYPEYFMREVKTTNNFGNNIENISNDRNINNQSNPESNYTFSLEEKRLMQAFGNDPKDIAKNIANYKKQLKRK